MFRCAAQAFHAPLDVAAPDGAALRVLLSHPLDEMWSATENRFGPLIRTLVESDPRILLTAEGPEGRRKGKKTTERYKSDRTFEF